MAQPATHNGTYAEFFNGLLKGTIKAESLHGDGTAQLWYVDPGAPDVVAVGGIYETLSNVNPGLPTASGGLGYGTWSRIAHGRALIGVDEGGGFPTPNAAVGQATVTPAGTVSPPLFTGTPLAAHGHGPGTLAPSAHTGAAVQDHASHTHTYTQVPNHVHVERVQGGTTASTTGTHIMTSAATGGSLRSAATSTLDPTGASNPATTNGPGAALTHSVTQPSAHTMSGSTAADTAGTPSGTNSAPVFTGAQHTLMQPSLTVFIWTRTA